MSNQAYLVTSGKYDDYQVRGVFLSLPEAEAFKARHVQAWEKPVEIEEKPLGDPNPERWYDVWFQPEPTAREVDYEGWEPDESYTPDFAYASADVKAHDPAEAIAKALRWHEAGKVTDG